MESWRISTGTTTPASAPLFLERLEKGRAPILEAETPVMVVIYRFPLRMTNAQGDAQGQARKPYFQDKAAVLRARVNLGRF